jgi:ABC-type sulfate/molybdate transport systems ATPase subunit
MLSIHNICLSFESELLNNISFDVHEREIIGIAGKSGAGKTSLLKVIAGLADADKGEIILDNKLMVGPSQKLIPGHLEIQLVNQDFNLDYYQTVEENLRNKILHLPRGVQNQFIDELLDLIELSDLKHHQTQTLSGGEQQRLAIARALSLESKVLLLDEPFVHLDTTLRIKLISYLEQLIKIRKMCVIIVTHNSEELLNLADKIIYLSEGKIKRFTTPLDFYYNFKSVKEGKMFGILNQATVSNKSIHFRPDEYEICSNNPEITIKFERSMFMGGYYLNEFSIPNNKKIILFNQNKMTNVEGITIRKKERSKLV